MIRLIRSLFGSAIVTAGATVLATGLLALSIEDKPRGPDAIRWTRNPMGLDAFIRSMWGPGAPVAKRKSLVEICHHGFTGAIVKICWIPPHRDPESFDWDHDGDVDLADWALLTRIAAPVRGWDFSHCGLRITYVREKVEEPGND